MQTNNSQEVTIMLGHHHITSKSATPDEDKITDLSLMVFDEYGTIENLIWIPKQDIDSALKNGIKLKLTTGKNYNFFGCVNFGYRVSAKNMEELTDVKFHLIYPDDFRDGIPMFICEENIPVNHNSSSITLSIKRLMSKISIKIDRSKLNENIKLNIIKARIGNCPKTTTVFTENKIEDENQCFTAGYSKNEFETDPMNKYGPDGISGEVSLFMLENMQGSFTSEGPTEFPEGDIRRKTCSYVEIDIEYMSSDKASWSKPLKYRFYIGENAKDLNVERNCHYHITITPENDGLSKDGWCIDKSGICTFVKDIKLSQTSVSFEYEGETTLLESTIIPHDATIQALSWSSSNNRVAEVSDTGLITAIGEGTCTITCSSTDGSGATASCDVTCKFKDSYMIIHPGEYIVGDIGDKVHIWCKFFPPSAQFSIGIEELEFDKNRGIYDYDIDKNGHGVTLTLKKPGRGILYMSAGHPINDSKMVVIEVNQP